VNLLRLLAVGAFYLVQLIHYHFFSSRTAEEVAFHQQATAIAAAWTMIAVAVLLCLRRQIFPAALKYVSSAADLSLLTMLAALGGGPGSPVTLAYFLIIALAGLRFSLRLVWCCTLGSMLGYLALVGMKDPVWFDHQHVTPPAQQLVTLVSLGITGIVVGQIVRRCRSMAEDYAERLRANEAHA
jgi:hypothetical protein